MMALTIGYGIVDNYDMGNITTNNSNISAEKDSLG